MNLRLFSDLHIEFDAFKASSEGADVIVLAGDIDLGVRGIDWIEKQGFDCPVVYVLGNHEYYKHRYPGLVNKIKDRAAGKDIHVLENQSVDLDGVRFHGTTLWTNFELFGDPQLAGYQCQQIMNDYHLIKKEPSYSKLRSIDVSRIHYKSIKWLSDSLKESKSSLNVVVTHHAPSLESVPERYRSNIITAAYASDLTQFIEDHRPDYWMHGHLHHSSNYLIGDCRVLCNPKGYGKEENPGFDPLWSHELRTRS